MIYKCVPELREFNLQILEPYVQGENISKLEAIGSQVITF